MTDHADRFPVHEWTPYKQREFQRRFPASWPRIKYQIDMAELRRRERAGDAGEQRKHRVRSFDIHRHREVLLKILMARERAFYGNKQPIALPGVSKKIAWAAAAYAEVSVEEMRGITQAKGVVTARMAAMFVIKQQYPNLGLAEIGKRFGGRDHSTVSNAIKRVREDLKVKGTRFLPVIEFIEAKISPRSTANGSSEGL